MFVTGFHKAFGCRHAWLSAALILCGAIEAQAQGNFGTIKGRLVWGGSDVPAAKVLAAVGQAPKDPQICAKDAPIIARDLVVDPKTKGVRYAFVYLVKPQGANPDAVKAILAKSPEVVIDQQNCEFIPYVTAMMQDQPLTFKSSEPVNHNIRYSAFVNGGFNQVLPPNGQMGVKLVAERLPIPLVCDIHPWMKGYIMVFEHPFFAITAEDGSFEIAGVPAGAQKFVIWQEKVGFVTEGRASGQAIQVKPGQVTDVGAVKLDPGKVK
jgi:hypothetical protein